jgi:translation initiation factor IF-3
MIRAKEIRVIDENGEQLGIMAPEQALANARERDLDLVEVAPGVTPPVCRIMNYGKFQYQKSKRAHDAKKHQKVVTLKEVKFRPKTEEHDYQFKKNHIIRFLEDGTTAGRSGRDRRGGETPENGRLCAGSHFFTQKEIIRARLLRLRRSSKAL